MRKICVITGSRSDASPLSPVIEALGDNAVVINTIGLLGNEVHVYTELKRIKPDMVLVLGDRVETLLAATIAAMLTIPIAHIHGGEITEGSTDDAMRHAITKLAYYHFVAHEDYAKRIVQMGESPDRVFVTGAPGVDQYAKPGLNILNPPCALVCYHPETLGNDEYNLMRLGNEIGNVGSFIVSTSNEDIGNQAIKDFWKIVGAEPKIYRQEEWISLMLGADVLIGNSSCFIIEGFTLGKKVINIGNRQKGRYEEALKHFADNQYAYGKPGEVSPKIAELLLTLPIPEKPRKAFYVG